MMHACLFRARCVPDGLPSCRSSALASLPMASAATYTADSRCFKTPRLRACSPLLLAGNGPRIANGAPIAEGLAMRLASVLEDDGYLFLRYVRPASESGPVLPSSI